MDERQRKGIADAFRPLVNLGAALQGSTLTQVTGDPNAGAALRQFGQAQTSMLEDMWFRREAEIFSKRHGEKYKAEIERAQNEFKQSIVSERIPIKTKEDFERLEKTAPPGTLVKSEDSKGLQITDEKGNPAYGYVEGIYPGKGRIGASGQYFIAGTPQAIEYTQKMNTNLMETFKNSTMQYLDAAGGITNDGGQTVVSKNNPYISESANRVVSGVSGFINMLTEGPRRVMQEQMQRAELYNAQQKMPFEREKMQLDAQIAREQMATQKATAAIGAGPGNANAALNKQKYDDQRKRQSGAGVFEGLRAAIRGGSGNSSPNTPAPAPAAAPAPGPGAMNDPNMSQDQLQLLPNQSVGQSYTQNAPDQGRVPDMTLQAGPPKTPALEGILQNFGILPQVANADSQMPNTSTETGPVTSMPPGGRAANERVAQAQAQAQESPRTMKGLLKSGGYDDAAAAWEKGRKAGSRVLRNYADDQGAAGVLAAPAVALGALAVGTATGISAYQESSIKPDMSKVRPYSPTTVNIEGLMNPRDPQFKVVTGAVAGVWNAFKGSKVADQEGLNLIRVDEEGFAGFIPEFKTQLKAVFNAEGVKLDDKDIDILLANSGVKSLQANSEFTSWSVKVADQLSQNEDVKRAIQKAETKYGTGIGPSHPIFMKAYKESDTIVGFMDKVENYVAPVMAKQKEVAKKAAKISKYRSWVENGETAGGKELSSEQIQFAREALSDHQDDLRVLREELKQVRAAEEDDEDPILSDDPSNTEDSMWREINSKAQSKNKDKK